MLGRLRGSLRVRLTAAFSLTLLAAGVTVLAGINILVRNAMNYGLNLAGTSVATNAVILASMKQNLWFKGGLTVFGVWAIATVAIWFIAGHLLRPLRRITDHTERVAARSLHRRIALNAAPGEVKTLADSFDHMLDRLDTAFAGQGRFIANAAHELKTPVSVTRTLIEVAMRRHGSGADVRDLGENLLIVNAQQEQLIEALLMLARSDAAITDRLPVDLGALAASAVNTTYELENVRLDCALRPAPALGDPVLLGQMIRNLVDNAMRYNVPAGQVVVATTTRQHWSQVVVSNTGPVIAGHEVAALFEPFRRLRDRAGSRGGNGLGLSIVRAVAQAHGGDVTATPRGGGGLDVCVSLPRAPAGAAATAPVADNPDPVGRDHAGTRTGEWSAGSGPIDGRRVPDR